MKKRFIYVLPLFLMASLTSKAQSLVVTDDNSYVTGQASSVLDVKSTTKGLLVPRMTQTQRTAISSPATGLLVFQTDGTSGFYYYDGSNWLLFTAGSGSTNITTLGTVTTGTWNGTVISPTYGGTGVNNGSNTITLGNTLTTSGNFPLTLTSTGSTNVTLPTSGTLVNSAVTTLSSLASVGTITTGTWNGTAIGATNGGTGQTSWTLGDIPYSSATNTVSKLAGNTTATKQYLTQTGNGTISAAPAWGAIAAADLPSSIDAAKLANGTVSNTEYQYLDGVTSAIQTQLGAKAASGTNTDITSVNLNQTGLTVRGATATSLTIRPNETLTSGRTLNLITNDADRTITLGGNITTAGALTTSGANALTLTTTGSTNVTLPTSGTLVNSAVTTLSSLASVGTITTGTWNGTAIGATNGGTGQTSWTLGDIPYSSATNTVSKLAGNTTTTRQFLSQTGNGTISAAPAWAALTANDMPTGIDAVDIANGSVSNTEFQYLDGVTSAIQTQLNGKQASGSYAASGANTDITSVNLNQTGLTVKGATATSLTIRPNETLTTARTLNLVTNDADRTITLGGNITTAGALTTSGANSLTLTTTGATNVTLPTTGTLVNSAVTSLSSLATVGTITSGTWNGTAVGPTFGGTGITTWTLGDMLYANGTNTVSKVAGNTTSAKQFLTQTGTGSVSAAPLWGAIAAADLPSAIDAAKLANGTVSNTEYQYLDGVTSAIQTQLGTKAAAGANTDITSVNLNQTGLTVKGASSVSLTIRPNETLTSPRTLNLVTNDADRTITMSGNLTVAGTASVTGTNTGDQTNITGNAGTVTGLSITSGKTLTVTNTLDLAGNDGVVINVGAAGNGRFLIGNGADMVLSTSTIPTSAGATGGKVLVSDGTNYILSTPTFPNTSATINKVIKSDGTNWVASTETYAAPGTSGNIMQSDGTNWTSVANPSEPKWDTYEVASDQTTTGQSLVDITGLVTGTLATNTSYEFEAVLDCGTSNVNTGTRYGVNMTVTPTRILAQYSGAVTSTTGAVTSTNANNTSSATAFLTTNSMAGIVIIKGIVRTAGTGSPVFSIRHLKVTSGTSTVRAGSVLRIRQL